MSGDPSKGDIGVIFGHYRDISGSGILFILFGVWDSLCLGQKDPLFFLG